MHHRHPLVVAALKSRPHAENPWRKRADMKKIEAIIIYSDTGYYAAFPSVVSRADTVASPGTMPG